MTQLLPVVLSSTVFVGSMWLTGRFRRYALARGLMDVPNTRSSHAAVTPRGGGVAIVITTLVALLVLAVAGALRWPVMWGLLGGGATAAIVGFVDDRRHVAARWRLLGHFAAAAWVLVWIGGMPPVRAQGIALESGLALQLLAAIYLVWMLNLTNFMDGIDGIASLEVISVCWGGILLSLVTLPSATMWLVPLTLASATLGFLVWNWPPAKIFMGDAGSGFLGLMLGVLSLEAGWESPRLLWAWVILLGVFVVDATVTLIRRVVRRERFFEAHRSHAYQHLTSRWGAHQPVTVAVCAINLAWLLPIALLVALGHLDGLYGLVIAYLPLAGTAVWLGAGT